MARKVLRPSSTWLAMARATVPTVAPGPESVSVEKKIPIAATLAMPASTYRAAPNTRSTPAPVPIDVPDSVGSGPRPKAIAPGAGVLRVLGAALYVEAGIASVAAIGIFFSTLTDSGPGATVGTVALAIAS